MSEVVYRCEVRIERVKGRCARPIFRLNRSQLFLVSMAP